MDAIEVHPLNDDLAFGARVRGVTVETLGDEGVRQQLRELFEARGMILFEDMDPSDRLQVMVSEVFGPLKPHPVKAVDLADADGARATLRVIADPAKCDIVEIDGKAYSSWLPWHFDHCYNNELNRAGVLRITQITPSGGQTCFMDGKVLYETLPDDLRDRIEDKSIIYSLDMQPDHIRFGRPDNFRVLQVDPAQWEILEQAKEYPRAIHPAVWQRPTGEKILHLSPWMAEGIEGEEDSDGDALLAEVAEAVNALSYEGAYVHDWKPTDMIIWDNWRMLHAVTGCTPPHMRTLQRTTIRGDYGLGRFENDVQGVFKHLQRAV